MRYTNTANLPEPLVSAITYSDYDKVGDISATGLIEPPRIRQLKLRHADEIVEDAAEGIWRLLGSIGHKILERANTDNHLSEERITARVLGWTVTGKADLLSPDMTLDDYKFTSVWAVKDAKIEWEQQLNIYAWLYRANGFEPKRARIVAPLRDWSKLKAKREKDYPQVGVVVREVPLWKPSLQQEFVKERVRLHKYAALLTDDELPMCTDKERWYKPDKWAVKKYGAKRALQLFDNEADAIARKGGAPQLVIEHRPGSYPRCESYCAVKQFCSFGKTL